MPSCARCGTILFEGTTRCPTCGYLVESDRPPTSSEKRSPSSGSPRKEPPDRRPATSLVLGVLGLFPLPLILSFPAILVGARFLRHSSRGAPRRRLAAAGVVLGVAGVLWGVLLAVIVLIPAYVGVKNRALDRQVQVKLRDVLVSAKTLGGERFEGVSPETLRSLDRKTIYVGPGEPSTGPTTVSLLAGDGFVIASSYSRSGTCFFIGERSGEVGYAKLRTKAGGCRADSFADSATQDGW